MEHRKRAPLGSPHDVKRLKDGPLVMVPAIPDQNHEPRARLKARRVQPWHNVKPPGRKVQWQPAAAVRTAKASAAASSSPTAAAAASLAARCRAAAP